LSKGKGDGGNCTDHQQKDDRIRISDQPLLLRTIEVYERHRLAFADAYLVASAERSGVGIVVSFDEGISRVGTVQRLEP
jgi:predicted nucleic acid-binding protein